MGENAPEELVLNGFPDSRSPSLHLTTATPEEKLQTWTLNAVNWGTALPLPDYLERESYLTTVPLARNNGITHWVLVDRSLSPNERPILASCESLCKPVLVSKDGVTREGITHGIGSVFSQPKYRGKGYAARMLRDLAPVLKTWQIDINVPGRETVPFSILYSDIGKTYYTKFGWEAHPSSHISLEPLQHPSPSYAEPLTASDLPSLCELDEKIIRKQLEGANDGKTYVALLPSNDQMQWHHLREDFVTKKIFGKTPSIRGAICGAPGSRIWAIWTRAYYGPLTPASGNTLHILRLVLEDEKDTNENAESLRGILQMAQSEAKTWQLSGVDMWNLSEIVKKLVQSTELGGKHVVREEESIASLMWYAEGGSGPEDISWIVNEKFGWC